MNPTLSPLEDFEASGHLAFIDGIVKGEPLGQSLQQILTRSSMFGTDEFLSGRSNPCPGVVFGADEPCPVFIDFDNLLRVAVASVVQALFGGNDLHATLNSAIRSAVSFGYEQKSDKVKLLAGTTAVEAALKSVTEAAQAAPDTNINADVFFKEVHALNLEHTIHYMRIFSQRNIRFEKTDIFRELMRELTSLMWDNYAPMSL